MAKSDIPNYPPDQPRSQKKQHPKQQPQEEEEEESTQSEFDVSQESDADESQESDADEFDNGEVNTFQSSNSDTFPVLSLNNVNGEAPNTIPPDNTFPMSNQNMGINTQSTTEEEESRIGLATIDQTTTPPSTGNNDDEGNGHENETGLIAYFRRKELAQQNPDQAVVTNKVSKPPRRRYKKKVADTTANDTIDQIDGSTSQLSDTTGSEAHRPKRRELTSEERNYIYGINDGTALLQQKCEAMHKKFEELLMTHKKLRALKKSDIAELLKKSKPPRLSGTDLAQVSGFKYETYKTTLRRRRVRTNGHTVKRSGRRRKEDKEAEEAAGGDDVDVGNGTPA